MNRIVCTTALLSALALVSGCETVKNITGKGSSSDSSSASASDSKQAANTDPNTQHVKGINDTEGDIVGKPAAGSRFSKLQIGMGMRQVTDLIGQPTDQGAYATGKAWIPYYFGGDRHRQELIYKGQGRLIFSGGGVGDFSSGRLTEIVHNASESGYR